MNNGEIDYLIKKGDNLYEIAKKYNTSVDNIMKNNPYLNPYNLIIGTYIRIPIINNNYLDKNTLKEKMRKVWEQHVFWTRLVIVSIIERLKDEPEATKRLLENPKDLANLYQPYYGKNVADAINNLITDHLVIASKLIYAIINNQNSEAAKLDKQWYKNADDIAIALSNINPYYSKEVIRKMLYGHLDLTKEEIMNRINRNYKKEIEVFDKIENQALMMADYFIEGIYNQFKR